MDLPQNDGDAGARTARLANKREIYRFAYDWPPGVATSAELPRSDDYGALYLLESVKTYAEIGVNVAAMALEGHEGRDVLATLEARFAGVTAEKMHELIFSSPREIARSLPPRSPKSWDEYRAFFATWRAPDVVAFYDDPAQLDLAFAWQRVAGVNPMVLARCDRLPDHLGVDDARYRQVMGADDSLASAIAEQRLYLADYAPLAGIATGTTDGLKKYITGPMALFAVPRGQTRLRPVAVQLGQTPDAPTFTPRDGWRWRVAMLHVQIADANHHEGVAHLGRTHMVMEAVKLCLERQLDESHPLHRLLSAHLETTLAINHSAKTSLIAPGGTVDRCFAPTIEAFAGVVKNALDTYPISTATPKQDLEARGLTNTEVLEHPYRDDVGLVWDAVEAFVSEYVDLYYASDADVQRDTELRAFVEELGAQDGGRLVEVPRVSTVRDVKALVTKLVFIAGPGHSAVNFPQYPSMGFVPNMTGASFRPLSVDLADDEQELTGMLPPLRIAMEGVTMIYFLSNTRVTKLGQYAPFHFRDLAVSGPLHRFQRALEGVESIIDEREPRRLMSYPFLKPSQVLQSISI
jgi:arachidonate 15-lipoxygenase